MVTNNLQNEPPKKKRLFLLTSGRTCPLSFNAVMVYSFLVYRLKVAKGMQRNGSVTRQQIHCGTGLSATRTIPAALEELDETGLIGWEGGTEERAFSWQPKQNDWFVMMKNAGLRPWYSRFTYTELWIPESAKQSGLVPRVNALYFLIRQRPEQKQIYYALKLNISEGTVRSGIRKLRQLRLLSPSKLSAKEPSPEQLAFWQDQKARKSKAWRLSQTELFRSLLKRLDGNFLYFQDNGSCSSSQVFEKVVDWFGQKMSCNGYTKNEIESYWTQTIDWFKTDNLAGLHKLELFINYNFTAVFDFATKKTLKSASAGNFYGSNSFGLLLRVTKEVINEINIAWDTYSTAGLGRCTHQWHPKD